MQMIPMITKEKLVETIRTNKALFRETIEAIIYYLELPTPSLNPMKIDEERMRECFEQVFTKDIYLKSHFKTIVDQYNSTLEDHQVLQPLPDEMPEGYLDVYANHGSRRIWEWIVKHYGTPTKKELVSVEELEKEIRIAYNKVDSSWKSIAQHIIDTYSLNPPKREWWMDCEKFVYDGNVIDCHGYNVERSGLISLYNRVYGAYTLKDCTPYIEPSIHDKVKEKLGTELYEEFMKEVKNG